MYSKSLNYFVTAAFIGLLAASFYLLRMSSGSYMGAVMAGALPLSVYFLLIFALRSKIAKTQIDTVYYFGFLITILTLGLSAYEFKTEGLISIEGITKQFSVGLIATGVALVYRLILISTETKVEDHTQEIKEHTEAVKRLRDEISLMFVNFKTCTEAFSEATSKCLESATFTHDKTSKQLEELHSKSIEIISLSLEKAMGSSMAKLKDSSSEAANTIQLFNANVGNVAKSTELKNVHKSLSKLSETFDEFGQTMTSSTSNILSSASVVNVEQLKLVDVVSGSAEASKALVAMRKMLEEEQAHALNAKIEYTKSMDELTGTIKKLVEELQRQREKTSA